MKNKKERETFFDTIENWETKEQTAFTRTMQLEYKGERWIKIQTREWSSYYDHDFHKICHEARWIDKGHYIINELFECLEPITRTDIIAKMTAIDKERPDRASAPAIPQTMEIERKGK